MNNMHKTYFSFIVFLILIIVWIVFASEKDKEFKVIFSQDRSILTNPHMTVICKLNEDVRDKPSILPNLIVNGMEHEWKNTS